MTDKALREAAWAVTEEWKNMFLAGRHLPTPGKLAGLIHELCDVLAAPEPEGFIPSIADDRGHLKELINLRARCERLEAALEDITSYAVHEVGCMAGYYEHRKTGLEPYVPKGPCTCGLTASIKNADALRCK